MEGQNFADAPKKGGAFVPELREESENLVDKALEKLGRRHKPLIDAVKKDPSIKIEINHPNMKEFNLVVYKDGRKLGGVNHLNENKNSTWRGDLVRLLQLACDDPSFLGEDVEKVKNMSHPSIIRDLQNQRNLDDAKIQRLKGWVKSAMGIDEDILILVTDANQGDNQVTVLSTDKEPLRMVEIIDGEIRVAQMSPKIEDLPRETIFNLVTLLSGIKYLEQSETDIKVLPARNGQTEVTLRKRHINFDIMEDMVRMIFDRNGKPIETKTDFPRIKSKE